MRRSIYSDAHALRPQHRRAEVAGPLARSRPAQDPHRPGQAQVLRARHVPLPFGRRACTSATARATRPPTSSRAGSGCRASGVLHPMGWDAFGLPAENYAIKHGVHPRVTTAAAIANFKRQIDAVGFAYDWTREIDTTDPGVREVDAVDLPAALRARPRLRGRHPDQLVPRRQDRPRQRRGEPGALRALRHGGRAQGHAAVAAAHHRATPIACWRISTSSTGRRRRWRCSATGSAAARAPRWSSTSAAPVAGQGDPRLHHPARHALRRDLHGALARARAGRRADHARAARGGRRRIRKRRAARATSSAPISPRTRPASSPARRRPTRSPASRSRSGSPTTCWRATAPAPSWPCRRTTSATSPSRRSSRCRSSRSSRRPTARAPDAGRRLHRRRVKAINSGPLDGLPTAEAKRTITARSRGARRRQGRRQLPAARLGLLAPALLGRADPAHPLPHRRRRAGARSRSCRCACPTSRRYAPTGTGESPLAAIESWVATTCPKCGGPAKRETNTMPQWAGSCWYYLRYLDPKDDARAFDPHGREGVDGRSISTSAAPSTPCCTCSTRASGTRCSSTWGSSHTKEPFQKLRHQGTVLVVLVPGQPGALPRARRGRAARRQAGAARRPARR